MQGILPAEAQELLRAVLEKNGQISDQAEAVLLKLWQGQRLSKAEQDMDITPAEVAGIWSITHKRPLSVTTVRQAVSRRSGARKEPIEPSKKWGSGPTLRRLYRLGDVIDVKVQERGASKTKSAEQDQH